MLSEHLLTGRREAVRAVVFACAITVYAGACGLAGQARPGDHCVAVDRPATLRPDYGGAVIPPNISPLNFLIEEKGSAYFVKMTSERGEGLEVCSTTGEIRVKEGPWRRLLAENRGGELRVDIYVRSLDATSSAAGQGPVWTRFQTLRSAIAKDPIDDFIVYRRIRPVHSTYRDMGIYQRDLRSFDERPVFDNGYFKHGCVNCHTFCNNHTEEMLLSIRSGPYGSSAILTDGHHVSKIGTKFGYAAWHPSGKLIAFSVNDVRQVFHSAADEVRDVMDFDSLITTYRVDEKVVRAAPPLARKERLETYPAWSPDGKSLYFCSAPKTWHDQSPLEGTYDRIRYDLMRAPYDVNGNSWGEPETVLSASEAGQSILLPRISPDGRWLLFTMCDYGCFPVYRKSSDLYLMDLHAEKEGGHAVYRRLDINSDASESWHSWSSNGRWIAFSSKRLSHLFTRIYLAYVDEQGQVHKPVLLPQKDPAFYDSCLWTFSVPELVTEPVPVRGETIGRVVRGSNRIEVKMPVTMATPKADATPRHDDPR